MVSYLPDRRGGGCERERERERERESEREREREEREMTTETTTEQAYNNFESIFPLSLISSSSSRYEKWSLVSKYTGYIVPLPPTFQMDLMTPMTFNT